jgi:hypothetical protein
MKVTIHYQSRFGFRHCTEETTARKVGQAVRVLNQAGCTIKAVTLVEAGK